MAENSKRWSTACHEAAHAVVNHMLAICTVRIVIQSENDGVHEPEPLFESLGGELAFERLHGTDGDRDYAWFVNVLRRHAIAAYAGPVMRSSSVQMERAPTTLLRRKSATTLRTRK